MATEARRGCGYRKAGGLYLTASLGNAEPCERLPVPLEVCPHCGQGIKQSRSSQWIPFQLLLDLARPCKTFRLPSSEGGRLSSASQHCTTCPLCLELRDLMRPVDQVLLLWVGEKFYPTVQDWSGEALKLGLSKRLPAIPKEFVPGATWLAVAHPKGIRKDAPAGDGEIGEKADYTPAVFQFIRSGKIEVVVTPSMKKQRWVKALQKQWGDGLQLVEVPEDDPDHAPVQKKKSARAKAQERAANRAAREAKKKTDEGLL